MQATAPLALLAALALAACNPVEPASPRAAAGETPPAVGMANPASVACGEAGGESVAYTTPEGQIGVCYLKDGRKCEEWALFRDKKCEGPPPGASRTDGRDGQA